MTDWIPLLGGIAIAVLFYEELDRIGYAVGQWIGNAIVSIVLGPNGERE